MRFQFTKDVTATVFELFIEKFIVLWNIIIFFWPISLEYGFRSIGTDSDDLVEDKLDFDLMSFDDDVTESNIQTQILENSQRDFSLDTTPSTMDCIISSPIATLVQPNTTLASPKMAESIDGEGDICCSEYNKKLETSNHRLLKPADQTKGKVVTKSNAHHPEDIANLVNEEKTVVAIENATVNSIVCNTDLKTDLLSPLHNNDLNANGKLSNVEINLTTHFPNLQFPKEPLPNVGGKVIIKSNVSFKNSVLEEWQLTGNKETDKVTHLPFTDYALPLEGEEHIVEDMPLTRRYLSLAESDIMNNHKVFSFGTPVGKEHTLQMLSTQISLSSGKEPKYCNIQRRDATNDSETFHACKEFKNFQETVEETTAPNELDLKIDYPFNQDNTILTHRTLKNGGKTSLGGQKYPCLDNTDDTTQELNKLAQKRKCKNISKKIINEVSNQSSSCSYGSIVSKEMTDNVMLNKVQDKYENPLHISFEEARYFYQTEKKFSEELISKNKIKFHIIQQKIKSLQSKRMYIEELTRNNNISQQHLQCQSKAIESKVDEGIVFSQEESITNCHEQNISFNDVSWDECKKGHSKEQNKKWKNKEAKETSTDFTDSKPKKTKKRTFARIRKAFVKAFKKPFRK